MQAAFIKLTGTASTSCFNNLSFGLYLYFSRVVIIF